MSLLRKRAGALALCMLMSAQISWADSVSMNSHWAYGSMVDMAKAQVFSPKTSEWNLDQPISRAEFVRLTNKAWGIALETDLRFSDVSEDHLYYEDIVSTVAQGYVNGYPDGTFKPERAVSRQEAAVIISKMAKIETTSLDLMKGFQDGEAVPDWSKDYMSTMVLEGYYSGYPDKTIRAGESITYGEAIAMVENLMGHVCDKDMIFEEQTIIEGNVSVIRPDVTLQNLKVEGDVIIGGQIDDGDVTLSNVEVTGTLLVFGGGTQSIHLENARIEKLLVDKKDSAVRIFAKEGSEIGKTVVQTTSILEEEIGTLGFGNVEVNPVDDILTLDLKGSFEEVTLLDNKDVVTPPPNENPNGMNEDAANMTEAGVQINLAKGSEVAQMKLERKSKIMGQGKITAVHVGDDQVVIDAEASHVKLSDKVDSVVIKGEKVSEDKDLDAGDKSDDNRDVSSGGSKKDKDKDKDRSPINPEEPEIPEEPELDEVYTLLVKPSFLGAPTVDILVQEDGETIKGCILNLNGKQISSDDDEDGVLCIPGVLFDREAITINYKGKEIDTYKVLN